MLFLHVYSLSTNDCIREPIFFAKLKTNFFPYSFFSIYMLQSLHKETVNQNKMAYWFTFSHYFTDF